MTTWRHTWVLAFLAAGLLAFIVLYERRHSPTTAASAPAPVRLLPHLKAAAVTALQVSRTNQLLLKVERSDGSWTLTAPLNYPAAPVAAERLLAVLEHATVAAHLSPRDLVARGLKNADFGLDPPLAVVVLEQGPERQELQLGTRTVAGDQFYAQVVGLPGLEVVEAGLLDLLPQSVHDWRNLALFDLSGWESLDRLELARTNGPLFMQREPPSPVWQLSRPRQRADQLKVEGLLDKLQQARVTQFVSDDPKADLETYGLQTPQLELTLGQGTNRTQRVQFGRSPPNDTTNVYARRLSQTNIVLVPLSLLQALNTPLSEFRDRRLLAFDPDTISLIEVRSDEPFSIRRLTNQTWLAGETTPADTLFIKNWLWQLSRLQVTDFVKDVVTDFSSYGLAPPRRQYVFKTTVTNAAGLTNVTVGELHFGTNTADQVRVRRADEDSVYDVRYVDFYRMPSAAWQLRDMQVWNFTTNEVTRVILRQNGRSRVVVRQGNLDWMTPEGPGIVNPLAVEEMVFRLGELHAVDWVARGPQERARFGFAETNLHISVEVKTGDKTQTLTLEFGGVSPGRLPYAATQMGGQVWIFEFPYFLFQDLERAFGLPLAPPAEAGKPD
jgi:hypothetical protein